MPKRAGRKQQQNKTTAREIQITRCYAWNGFDKLFLKDVRDIPLGILVISRYQWNMNKYIKQLVISYGMNLILNPELYVMSRIVFNWKPYYNFVCYIKGEMELTRNSISPLTNTLGLKYIAIDVWYNKSLFFYLRFKLELLLKYALKYPLKFLMSNT